MDAILGVGCLYKDVVQDVERTTFPQVTAKPPTVDVMTASDIREDLVNACSAAKTPGHPMRQVVLAHFADRVLALAADHQRLTAALAAAEKGR